jgi:peptidoglycan/LPS O-acetylase OafA/YrhL
MTQVPTRTNTHLSELDGLRAASILLVLFGHLLPLGPKSWALNFQAASMGMCLFFSLSGFLITSTLLNRPVVVDFLVRRFARILPLYYLYLFAIFCFWDGNVQRLVSSALFTINYDQAYLDEYTAHLWSLCVEIHFYIAIALGVALAGRRAVYVVWPACIAVTLIRISSGITMDIMTHLRVDEILAGACIATIYHNYGNRFRLSGMASAGLFTSVLLWAAACSSHTGAFQYFRPYGSALVLASAIWCCPEIVRKILSSKPLRYVAEISYALYVIHPATAVGWMNEGSTTVRYLIKRPISFALTFALAHASTFHWDSIWRKAASKFLKARKPSIA